MTIKQKNKILITVPDLNRPGGVASLFSNLNLNKYELVEYFQIHGYSNLKSINRLFELLKLYIAFIGKCYSSNVIHVNPSLNKKSFLRDSVFVFLGKILGNKVLIYWHGWDMNFEKKISKNIFLNYIFKITYLNADIHIVLGKCFEKALLIWGVKPYRIKIESNAASDKYLQSVIEPKSLKDNSVINILFIARLEREKGIYEAIETIKILKNKFNVHLNIAGSGKELSELHNYISKNSLSPFATLLGNVTGIKKHDTFFNSDILLFPTFHNEGMPISILEAMSYGLPVISRNVGGIPDWVEHEKNGFLFSSNNPEEYADCIEHLIRSPILLSKMSLNNLNKAKSTFTPQAVSERLFNYYSEILNR